MVRPNRIKQNIFSSFTVTGSVLSETYSSEVLNGDILKIRVAGITSPGSLWIAESGTDIEIWRRNNITSGLSNFEVYPRSQIVDSSNVTINQASGNVWDYSIVNSPVYIAASGLTSGTDTTFGPVTVFYR
jgi:hypothetical protein